MSNLRNADILSAKAGGTPRNADILSAPQPAGKTRNAEKLLPTIAGGTPAVHVGNADILSAKAGGTPRNADILSAPQPAEKTRNAEKLLPTIAGGTPAVHVGNADILSASPVPGIPAKPRPPRQNPLHKKGWHSRGYLPHWDPGHRPIHLVLRLYDSLPQYILAQWQAELHGTPEVEDQRRQRIEAALDQGLGECWLRQPNVARVVADALNHFDGERYNLHAWVIMPNHVHALFSRSETATLSSIAHSWKSFTAKQANRLLERTGQFWMEETYDRVMRSRNEFIATKAYIEQNPVAAGLCDHAAHWPWSSATTDARGTLRNADILPAKAGGTPRNADILSAPQPAGKTRNAEKLLPTIAGGTPAVQVGNADILSAKAGGTPRNADILSATKAGGTPAVQLRNAGILPASNAIQTPAASNSSSTATSRRANTNQRANR